MPENLVTLVTASGTGSMDRYGQRLAEELRSGRVRLPRLRIGQVELDIARAGPDRFGHGLSVRTLAGDAALAREVRRAPGLLHLTHHHTPRYAAGLRRPFVVTVHDLIRWHDLTGRAVFISRPTRADRLGLRLDYAAIRRAAHVITPSEASRRDLLEHLGLAPDRVTVVPLAIDATLFRPVPPRPAPWPYVLFVGSEHPRKNLGVLLEAFALLLSRPELREGDLAALRLVKVGPAGSDEAAFRDPTTAAVRRLGLEDRVVFTGEVPDADLPGWYAGARCLVMPSRAEGFGLPPLEAMACGCPVVVSSAGSLPEVTGGAAPVVDPDDAAGLADAMASLLRDDARRQSLVRAGLARAAQFPWQRTAQETAAVYDRVLASRPSATAAR